jgi:hypothetical protein
MLTNLKLFFWSPDANFQLWSQRLFFPKTFLGFSKMDKKNVQNRKHKILLGKLFRCLYNKLFKVLKERKEHNCNLKTLKNIFSI